jgi:hypothetical protein
VLLGWITTYFWHIGMLASPLLESIHGRWIVLFGIHVSALHFVLEVVHQGLSGWSCVDLGCLLNWAQ